MIYLNVAAWDEKNFTEFKARCEADPLWQMLSQEVKNDLLIEFERMLAEEVAERIVSDLLLPPPEKKKDSEVKKRAPRKPPTV